MKFDSTPWPRMFVGNIAVDLVDRELAPSQRMDALSANPLVVASANLHHIHHFADDESWVRRPPAVSVKGTVTGLRWLTLLDSVPLVRTAHGLSGRHWPKLSGSDLINPILESAGRGVRVGFLRGTVGTRRQLRELAGQRLPAIRPARTCAPTRWQLTDPAASERIAGEIRDVDVDMLVVALSKPPQGAGRNCRR